MSELPRRALSVRQPWAWAIIHGGKDVENRTLGAIRSMGSFPQRIAIHAAQGMTQDEYDHAAYVMRSIGVSCPPPHELVFGAVIGEVLATNITRDRVSPWFFGPYALQLAEPRACDPMPASGALGLFYWRARATDEVVPPKRWMLKRAGQS